MFGKLFERFKPIRLEDPFFGPLLFMKVPSGSIPYWESARSFAPTGGVVEAFIDAASPVEPTSQAQRDFFTRIERDYARVCDIVAEACRADEWARELMTGTFQDCFRLSSLSIPLCVEPEEDWDLSFDILKTDRPLLLTALMRGEKVTSLLIDG